jgi:hypothetical protein
MRHRKIRVCYDAYSEADTQPSEDTVWITVTDWHICTSKVSEWR